MSAGSSTTTLCRDLADQHYIENRVAICVVVIISTMHALPWSYLKKIALPASKHTILALLCILVLNMPDRDFDVKHEDQQPMPLHFTAKCYQTEQLYHVVPIIVIITSFTLISLLTTFGELHMDVQHTSPLHMIAFAIATSIILLPKFINGGGVSVRKHLQGNELWNVNYWITMHDTETPQQKSKDAMAFVMLIFVTYALVLAFLACSHLQPKEMQFGLI